MFKVAIGIVLALVILVVIIGAAAKSKGDKDKAEVASGGASAIDVTAQQLHDDYKANEVSADAKYRGRVLRVTGRLGGIKKGITDKPYLVLQTSNEFESVQAHFDDVGDLGSLKRGERVTVRCRGDAMIVGSPMLSDCILE